MPKTRPPCAEELKRRLVEMVRAGRSPPAAPPGSAIPDPRAAPPRWFYPIAILLGCGLGLALGLLGLRLAGRNPRTLLQALLHPASVTEARGFHEPDPELSVVHRPNARFRHTTEQFDVTYHIDAQGARLVPGGEGPGPLVEVLGDSWTFGHGVADDQTFASVLAREHWPGLTVRNRAVMGYGTTQAMQTLERDLARGARPALVLYGWMFFHATRSGRRASQLEKNALKRAPWFEVEGGQLVFKGQAGPEDAVPDTPEDPSKAEWAISRAALRRMRDDVARQGSRFVVLIFPSLSWDGSHRAAARRLRLMLDEDGIAYLDVANDPEFGNEDALYYEGDWHPRAEWHRRLAAAIARGLTSPTTQAATRVACLPR